MDEGNQQPQLMGGVQHHQRQVQHSRPFFYVQPPSQPYYNMYHHHNQWHMNSPYNHYGLPGSGGYPFGRFSPYMSPYPYMQYPGGYVVPHAPHMHPIDYRRMYEPPRFHPPPGHDIVFRQQAQAQREMACSEVQTDPSDALNKLIECLDKLRTNETQGSDKELDSGVVSQASGIFSPDERRRKHEEDVEVGVDGMHSHSEALLRGKLEGSHLQSSSPMARLFSANDSTTAVYDGESSRSLGDPGHPEGWAVDSDEDPPQDSSSVHEENVENQELLQYHPDEEDQESLHRCSSENICLLSAASQADESPVSRPEELEHQVENGTDPDGTDRTQGPCFNLLSPLVPSPVTPDWRVSEDKKPWEEMLDVPDGGLKGLSDLSCQIPCLTFDKVLTTGVLQTDSPDSSAALLCEDLQASLSSALLATTTTSSPANHHYYPYYCPPQTAHERLSVLSPSLDELSSRDEVFSTDLDDLDVFPRHGVYAGRRFSGVEEVCPKSKKLMCACCGSSLFKGTGSGGRVKGHHHSPKVYADDQEGDTDEEQRGPVRTFERPQPVRVVVKKHSVPKKRQPLSLHCRRPAENSCKRSQCREAVAQEEPPEDPAMGLMGSELDHCEGHGLQAQGVHEAANKQHRACKDRHCREGVSTLEPCRSEAAGAKLRWKPHSSLQERIAPRKALCNALVYQKVKDEHDDDDEEPPRLHRAKGSKREARC
ncbi:uncharacterized protein LOC105030056 [Esox lucius]|uniref:uncharacterized protein LOC105030056 n=1 Tax=Esox lucius TaxID=8010 RepID=UPI001477509B|nr:uncharacterized protein LOC105030056 [Esox lucius]